MILKQSFKIGTDFLIDRQFDNNKQNRIYTALSEMQKWTSVEIHTKC